MPASSQETPPSRAGPPPPARVVRSDDLLAGERELVIRHGNDLYRLRLTAAGKLILTK